MKLTKAVFCIALLAVAGSSCIREDFDDCLSRNYLVLSYKGDGTAEIFPDKINRVEMFVFDAENKCVNSGVLSREEVESRKVKLPPLVAGDYHVVCVGNTHDTKFDGIDSGNFNEMIFAASAYYEKGRISGNDSLYHASTSLTVEPFDPMEKDQVKVMEFSSSHYDLLVEVSGVPASGSGEGPVLEICGVSPCTDFENRACGDATDYLLETEYDAAQALLTARTNIMRHKNHENVVVRLRYEADEEPLAEVNLAEFLAKHPVIDCSKHEVLIPIRIEFKSGDITINLPDWFVEQIKPEF